MDKPHKVNGVIRVFWGRKILLSEGLSPSDLTATGIPLPVLVPVPDFCPGTCQMENRSEKNNGKFIWFVTLLKDKPTCRPFRKSVGLNRTLRNRIFSKIRWVWLKLSKWETTKDTKNTKDLNYLITRSESREVLNGRRTAGSLPDARKSDFFKKSDFSLREHVTGGKLG